MHALVLHTPVLYLFPISICGESNDITLGLCMLRAGRQSATSKLEEKEVNKAVTFVRERGVAVQCTDNTSVQLCICTIQCYLRGVVVLYFVQLLKSVYILRGQPWKEADHIQFIFICVFVCELGY